MRRYDLILVPHHKGRTFSTRFPVKALYAIAGVLVVIVGLNLLFSISYFQKVYDKARLAHLQSENQQLTGELEAVRSKLSDAGSQLTALKSTQDELRMRAGLPRPDAAAEQLNVGGPQYQALERLSGPQSVLFAKHVSYDLDRLMQQTRLEKDRLAEMDRVFTSNHEKLAMTPTIRPTQGIVSDGYGWRIDPYTGKRSMHDGIDIQAPLGTPIIATADGKVTSAGIAAAFEGYGRLVKINHVYYETWYAHMNTINVTPGQMVHRGDVIGTVGRSGWATGDHVHYEVHVAGQTVDPRKYFYPDRSLD